MKVRDSARVMLGLLLSTLLAHAAGPASARPMQHIFAGDEAALTSATHDLCHVQVAMLGESATHGDGHTEAFKVALVERLVDECGFDSVFFEASHYEFLHIARQLRTGQPVSADQVSAAVGGLWRFDREFEPLVPFLLAKARAGQISLGGIDDQLGMVGQDYANVDLVAELTGFLPPQRKPECSLALHHRIYSDYAEAAPYSRSDQSKIAACLAEVQHAVAADKTTDSAGREEREEMISAANRWLGRDFSSDAQQIVGRDRSMFQNFEWLRRQQPKRHKVILWAASVHIAKQGDPTWADSTGRNFGSEVRQKYGARAFSLGFSALIGSYRQGRRDVRELPPAPPESVESQALSGAGHEAVYVGPAQLQALGTRPGALFRHSLQTLPWAKFLDGVVVFREEHPPTRSQ